MPSWASKLRAVELEREAASSSERFTVALVSLTREVWHPGCTFETAVAAICKTACQALEVERVSMWEYEPEAHLLRCLHAYQPRGSGPLDAASLDTLSLDGDDYMAALKGVRALDSNDFDSLDEAPLSHRALCDYLRRYSIHALLDAPAFVGGQILGVISHESVDRRRDWTAAEISFAASMGDYVAMAYEIARRRSAEATVQHLLLHDGPTGLPNRELMEELLNRRLSGMRRRGETVAVVHARIDAACGGALAAGARTEEDVMVQVAARFCGLENDHLDLARVHSNGFAFALAASAVDGAAVRLAERCLTLVRELSEDDDDVCPGASVGIAFAAHAVDCDARALLRQAEEAADSAALVDRFAFEVFDIGRHDALVERLRIERAMRAAFADGHFELHYQPEYDADEHRWVAAEALLRWRHEGRLLSAVEFVGVAEASGLILALGSWIMHRACRDAADWPATPNGEPAGLRVNVSARQFDTPGLADDIAAALAQSGLAPDRLCLEITETTLMGDIEHALSVLVQLKSTGVRIAIDDFGTGYASLTYLKRLPVDVLKIDRSFVDGLPGDKVDAAIVLAVAGLADSLGIEVVAEGVECIQQQQALQAVGVHRMQGWLYAKAMDQASVCRLLSLAAPVVSCQMPDAAS
jgi:EAL domain-containing protein (putative c-di-GMP-specific phosphodiesterase class I)/GGDEF domain-containing protein